MGTLVIRTARKRHRCANAHAADVGNPAVANICTRWIEPGQPYVEGDPDPYYAGGFGHERICKPCSDGERALAKATGADRIEASLSQPESM